MPRTLNFARMSYNERMDRKNRKVLLKNLHDLKMIVPNSKLDMKKRADEFKIELLEQSNQINLKAFNAMFAMTQMSIRDNYCLNDAVDFDDETTARAIVANLEIKGYDDEAKIREEILEATLSKIRARAAMKVRDDAEMRLACVVPHDPTDTEFG